MSHAPIEEQHRAVMNEIGQILAEVFDGFGFCLLVFDLDSNDGRMNYLSNAKREDMVAALKEFVANAEGRVLPPPPAQQ